MPPLSSLIFVVIVAIWAAYLVRHWVHRRDHVATARSVDRFSESMRVLERRRSLQASEAAVTSRTYAGSLLRPARHEPSARVQPSARAEPPARAERSTRPSGGRTRSRGAAPIRALLLLLGSGALVTLGALAGYGVVAPWYSLVGVGAFALSLATVRLSVAWGRARQRSASRRAVDHQVARAAPEAVALHHPSPGEHKLSKQTVAATVRARPRREGPVAASPEVSALPDVSGMPRRPAGHREEVFDVLAIEAAIEPQLASSAGRTATDARIEQPTDGTWNPVPVPPPVYTRKAKVPRPAPQLTGSASLPSDGAEMALDEEFEDLPRIDRVS